MSEEKTNILYLMDYYYGSEGGTEKQIFELIKHLDRKRFHPRICLFQKTAFFMSNSFPCQVTFLDIRNLLSIKTLGRMISLTSKIRRQRIDIVHVFFNDASIISPLFCKIAGAKVVTSRRDMGFWYTRRNLLALKFSNMFVDSIICNSVAVKKNVKKWEGMPEKKLRVIYNGADKDIFLQPPQNGFREMHNIPKGAPIIGTVSNLYPIKRPHDLIMALKIVHERHEDAQLVFVGGGQREIEPLKEFSEKCHVTTKVHFLGRVKSVVPIVKHFSVCVLCSESEGLSNAIIEYMGCGKPVICTEVGGNTELVKDGRNGCLISVGDVKGLAKKICFILETANIQDELGKNGRELFDRDFSIERMVDEYMRFYEE